MQVDPASQPRFQEMFPTFTPAEIGRIRRYGESRRYADGEKLLEVGKVAPGAYVVLTGHVAVFERDGFGRVTPIVDHGPGQFVGEVVQLSGRVSLVDAIAEGEVEALLLPPNGLRSLLVADAALGERIMRAMILRRVQLLQEEAVGVTLIGPPASADVIRLQNFLSRNGYPLPRARPGDGPGGEGSPCSLRRHRRRIAACGLPGRLCARQSVGAGAGAPDRHVHAVSDRYRVRRRRDRGRAGRALDRGLRRLRGPVGRGHRRPLLWRPGGRQRAHRKLPRLSNRNLRSRARRARVPPGAEIRRRDHHSRRRKVARLRPGRRRAFRRHRRWRTRARPRAGDRHRRALSPPGDPGDRPFRGPRRLVLGLADRGAPVRRRGGHRGRRRQFGRPGRGLPVRARQEGAHDGARPRAGGEHVAIPDRPDCGDAEHRTHDRDRNRRARRRAGRRPSRRCAGATARAARRPRRRSATSSCSSGPIRRPNGSAVAASRSTRRALSSPARGAAQGVAPTPLQSSVPGVFAVGDVRSGSIKRVGGAIGEGAAVVAAIHGFLAHAAGPHL